MSVRVIAGSKRGRVLCVPQGRATRPTSSKVREAIFSILGNFEALRVLDLYAGSGALGIEALSRGADSAVFVERDSNALSCIRKNLQQLALEQNARVLPVAVALALERLASDPPFDLVFADPPWAEIDRTLGTLGRLSPLLSQYGRVVFEHPKRAPATLHDLPLPGLSLYDVRAWGDTQASFMRRTDRPTVGPN